jgi:hypothetical protein
VLSIKIYELKLKFKQALTFFSNLLFVTRLHSVTVSHPSPIILKTNNLNEK